MQTLNTPGAQTDSAPERREYYRIQDRIGLEIRKLPPDAPLDGDLFDGDHLKTLKAEFRRLDQEVRTQLASLAERDRILTGLIKSLNGKLDALARIMAFEQNPLQPEDWQEVSLSEGGLSFSCQRTDWRPGDRLALRMTLPPELFQPEAVASVLEVQPEPGGGTRVHTEFIRVQDSDRQQIARHVMRWQIRQRKKE